MMNSLCRIFFERGTKQRMITATYNGDTLNNSGTWDTKKGFSRPCGRKKAQQVVLDAGKGRFRRSSASGAQLLKPTWWIAQTPESSPSLIPPLDRAETMSR